jgi:hypothetical protein
MNSEYWLVGKEEMVKSFLKVATGIVRELLGLRMLSCV